MWVHYEIVFLFFQVQRPMMCSQKSYARISLFIKSLIVEKSIFFTFKSFLCCNKVNTRYELKVLRILVISEVLKLTSPPSERLSKNKGGESFRSGIQKYNNWAASLWGSEVTFFHIITLTDYSRTIYFSINDFYFVVKPSNLILGVRGRSPREKN